MSVKLTVEDFYTEIQHAATVAAPLFRLYGWTWGFTQSQDGIPSLNEIEASITELVQHTLDHFNRSQEEFPEAGVGSGRFSVYLKQFEDEQCLEIKLDLASKSRFKDWTFNA